MTPLHWAVKRNFLSLADFLIKKGAFKDAQDSQGRTPLHMTAKLNFFEMTKVSRIKALNPLQLLLRHQVKLTVKNKKGL